MDVMSKPDHPAPSLHPLPPFNPNFIPPLPLPSSQRLAPAPQTLHFPPYQFPSAPRPVNASAVEVKPTFNPLAGQTQIPHLPSPTPQSTNETIQTEPNPVRYSLTSFYNPSAPTTQVVPSLPLSQDNPPIPPSFNYQLISAAFSSTFNSSSGSTYQYPPAFTMSDTPTKRGKWTPAEDAMLKQIVAESGPDGVKDWLLVSKKIPNRSHKQCRERWTNHLDPLIKKESWTEDEKCQLVRSWFRYGNQWSRIAVDLPGRSQNDIKNRMYSILRYWNTQEARHKTAKYFDQEELAAATGKVNKKGDGIGIKDIVEQIIRSGRNIPAVFFPKGGMSRPGSLSEVGFGLGLTLRGHTRQIMADGTETQQSEIDHDPSRERRIREKRKKRKKDELLDEYVGLDEIDEELEWIAKQKRELESDEESSKSSERTPVKLPPKLPVSIAKPKPQLKVDPVVEIKVEDDLLDDSLFDSDTPSQSDKDTPLAPPIPTSITPQPTKRTKRSTPLPRREPSQRRVTSTPSTPASDKRKTELVNESPFMSGKRSIRKSSWLLNDYVIPQQKPRKKRKKPKNKQKLIVVKTEPMDVQSDVFLADFGFSESSHSTEDDIDQSELPALPEATPVPARMTRGQKKKMKEDEQHTPTRNRLVSHNSLVDTPISQRSERIERMDQNDPERITTPVNPSRITQPALSPFSLGTMTHSPGFGVSPMTLGGHNLTQSPFPSYMMSPTTFANLGVASPSQYPFLNTSTFGNLDQSPKTHRLPPNHPRTMISNSPSAIRHAREGEKLEHDVLTSINTPLHNRMIDEKIEGPSGNVDSRLHDVKSKMAKSLFSGVHLNLQKSSPAFTHSPPNTQNTENGLDQFSESPTMATSMIVSEAKTKRMSQREQALSNRRSELQKQANDTANSLTSVQPSPSNHPFTSPFDIPSLQQTGVIGEPATPLSHQQPQSHFGPFMATPQPVQHHSHQILDSQPFQTPITTEQHPHSVQQPSVFVLDSIREREGEVKEAESEDELKEGIRRDSKQVRAILKQRRRLEKMDEISDNSTHMSTSFSSISHFSSPSSGANPFISPFP